MMRVSATRSLMPLLVLLLLVVAGCRNPVQSGGHKRADGVVITDVQGQEIARLQGTQWQGSPLALQVGQERPVRIYFLDAAGERFQLPHSGASHTLQVAMGNAGIASFEPRAGQGEGVFRGVAAGSTTAAIMVWHGTFPGGHEDYTSQPPLEIAVAP